MQALHSSFTYASSEVRRTTQPIIDTLAPIIPTFGCGEAEVKQSLSNCIHEMEADAISGYHMSKLSMGWSSAFSTVKHIVLYPLMDPSGTIGSNQKCRDSTEQELAILANVTNNINEQLGNWSIPFRFEISDLYMSTAELLKKESNNCFSRKPKKNETMVLAFAHCDNPLAGGLPAGGYQGACHVVLKTGHAKQTIAHELAHIFAPHTFDAIPLKSMHPDVTEAMCNTGVHEHELITSLSYWNHCRDAGFPDTFTHQKNSRGQWGPIELTLAKLATHQQRDTTHAQIHAEGVDQSYEWVRQNYGPRIAEQFVGSFVKSVFIHTMSAVAARSITDKRLLRLSKVLIHTVANLLHLGMMSQINTNPLLVFVHGLAGQGLMGRTARALIDVIGDTALLRSFVQLMQGNSDYMLQMVYATCGTAAGNLFSQLIYGFIEMCVPTEAEQRTTYVEMSRPTGMWGLFMDEAVQFMNDKTGKSAAEAEEKFMSRLPSPIRTIINIDKAVAGVIQNYVSLQVMTSWLWKKDQQQADTQVQASVNKLSSTLGEVKTKFGHTDLPRIPTNTRSFGLTQPVPQLDLDRDTDDDPLLFMEGAAVTGIGKTSPSKKPQVLATKKQQ